MATNWKSLFDPNPTEIWSAKPQKSEADLRRAKLIKGLDKAIAAAEKGEKFRGVVFEKAGLDDRYGVKLKVGKTTVKVNGEEMQTIPRERLADGLKALRAAAAENQFDVEIAAAHGDGPASKPGRGRRKAS